MHPKEVFGKASLSSVEEGWKLIGIFWPGGMESNSIIFNYLGWGRRSRVLDEAGDKEKPLPHTGAQQGFERITSSTGYRTIRLKRLVCI
jgi:hypothetical protein